MRPTVTYGFKLRIKLALLLPSSLLLHTLPFSQMFMYLCTYISTVKARTICTWRPVFFEVGKDFLAIARPRFWLVNPLKFKAVSLA